MTTEEFTEILESGTNEIINDYSGRGMFGETCVGFTAADIREAFGVFADCLSEIEDADERDAFVKCFRYVQTDSMGFDTIFYFPQMRTTEDV